MCGNLFLFESRELNVGFVNKCCSAPAGRQLDEKPSKQHRGTGSEPLCFHKHQWTSCTSPREASSPHCYLQVPQTKLRASHPPWTAVTQISAKALKAETCTPIFTMHINKYSLFKFCTLRFNILHPKHFANGCLLCKILYSAHCHSVQNYRYNITLPLVCFL